MTVAPAILLTLVLIFLNGFFVAIEFSLIGARRTRMEQLAKENNKSAKRVGRGAGSGNGKTSGKGHNGQKARSGGKK